MPRGEPFQPGSETPRFAGRIGGLETWTRDPEAAQRQLAAARRKFENRFPTERERRLYYARLALASAQARKRKAPLTNQEGSETAEE